MLEHATVAAQTLLDVGTVVLAVGGAILGVLLLRRWGPDHAHVLLLPFAMLCGGGSGALVLGRARRPEQRVEEDPRLAIRLFESSAEGVIVTLPSGVIIAANDAYTRLHGYTRETVLGKNPRIMKSDRHDGAFYRRMWDSLLVNGSWEGEIWDRRADGAILPKWLSISALTDDAGKTTHYVGIFSDPSCITDSAARRQWLASCDALTGLPNQAVLNRRLAVALAQAATYGTGLSVLHLDVDGLKALNDAFGYAAGDRVLIEMATRLTRGLRDEDTVVRMSGDEFVVVLPGVSVQSEVEAVANWLRESVAQPIALGTEVVSMPVTIGFATYPADGTEAATLLRRAGAATGQAKSAGGRRCARFSAEMEREAERLARTEHELRSALDEERIVVLYQPQVDLRTGRVTGVEALARIRSAEGTLIPPNEFIPVAEGTGLIIPLGEQVLRRACTDVALLHAEGHHVSLGVNFSVRQFRELDIAALVLDVTATCGLQPADLEIEVTETALVKNPAATAEKLSRLQAAGVTVALDDFGIGYSSLAYIQIFRPDRLKIDRSFVHGAPGDRDAEALVRGLIALASNIGAQTVAEGPETAEEVAFLRAVGCDCAQGYYFSPAVSLDELRTLLATGVPPLPGAMPSPETRLRKLPPAGLRTPALPAARTRRRRA
jgi:diguanylate cyclase (GGDEF)-like protein/PAS domain S-box-containing protein